MGGEKFGYFGVMHFEEGSPRMGGEKNNGSCDLSIV